MYCYIIANGMPVQLRFNANFLAAPNSYGIGWGSFYLENKDTFDNIYKLDYSRNQINTKDVLKHEKTNLSTKDSNRLQPYG